MWTSWINRANIDIDGYCSDVGGHHRIPPRGAGRRRSIAPSATTGGVQRPPQRPVAGAARRNCVCCWRLHLRTITTQRAHFMHSSSSKPSCQWPSSSSDDSS